MKNLKLALIATIVACAVMNAAYADEFKTKPKKCVNIVLSKALQDPGLVIDMYKQLNPEFLNHPQPLYLVNVVHEKVLYRIMGSHDQWVYFFEHKWKYVLKVEERRDLHQ